MTPTSTRVTPYAASRRADATPLLVIAGAMAFLAAVLVPVFDSSSRTAFMLLAVLGALGAAAMLAWPHIGVLVILGVWFAEISPAALGSDFLRIPYVVSALLALPLGVAILRDRDVWVLRDPQIKLLLGIGALYLLSTAWVEMWNPIEVLPELDETRRQLVLFASRLLFVVFFVYFVTTRARIEAAVALVVILTALAAFDSWGTVLTGRFAGRAHAALFDKNPNRLAFVCLFAVSLLWFFVSSPRGRRWAPLAFPPLLFLPATALATGSRSGFLQGALLGVLALKGAGSGSALARVRAFAMIGVAILVLVAVVPAPLLERATRFNPDVVAPGQESLNNRMLQLRSAGAFALGEPIFGIGIGNFEAVSLGRHGIEGGVHNSYVRALVEGGIGVLALYLWLFYVSYRALARVERDGPPELRWLATGTRVGLLLFLLASVTGDIWLNEHLYLVIAISIVLPRVAQERVVEVRHAA